jgi:hypothetical protein
MSVMRLALLLAALSASQPVPAQPPAAPCTAAEHRQFDFWLGHWEVFTPDGKKAGENTIEAIDGGCALIERWRGSGGFSGTSLNSWDRGARQWRQHWVDNQGGLLRLVGALDGRRMVLGGADPHPSKPGVTLGQRITWTALPDGAVHQVWQTSEDGGSTWTTVFDGRYQRAGR